MLWAFPPCFHPFLFSPFLNSGCPLLCSNSDTPHKHTGFQPQRIKETASRLSQMRTIVSWTLYITYAPTKLCTMGMNKHLSLHELLLYKGWTWKSIYISLNVKRKENSCQRKKNHDSNMNLVSVFFLYSFFFRSLERKTKRICFPDYD